MTSPAAPAPRGERPRSVRDPESVPEAVPRRSLRPVLLVAVPIAALLLLFGLYLGGGRYVRTDNAYVGADRVAVSTDVSGSLVEVGVSENDRVEAGQLLFRVDPEPYRIALAIAEAQLADVRSEIESAQASYRQHLAEIRRAEANARYLERQHQRERDLAERDVTSQSRFDGVQRDLETASQQLLAAREQARASLARLGGEPDAAVETQPRYRAALGQVERARRDLRRTEVLAPSAGVVAQTDRLQLGEYVPAGRPALSLVASDDVWIEANPKETDLTHLRVGNPATVTVDSYPGVVWSARVESVSPATISEFAVLPAQHASGNWVKVVQRIELRLSVEVPPEAPPLRVGMSAQVEIDTGHRRSLADLVRVAGNAIGF